MPKLDTTINADLRKNTGAHYTPDVLADFVATKIFRSFERPDINKNHQLKIIDPAVGDGSLLCAAISEAKRQGFKNIEVTGFDINRDAIVETREVIRKSFTDIKLVLHEKDFLQHILDHYIPNLLNERSAVEFFDIVIANPPYVRTQVMGSKKVKMLSEAFDLTGRTDLYHAFLKAVEKILKPNSVVGIIVSNRFMTTKAGQTVRKDLLERFRLEHIWDFGDTHLFEAAVLPAVLLLKKGQFKEQIPYTSVYLNDNQKKIDPYKVFDAINGNPQIGLKVLNGVLDYENSNSPWRLSTSHNDQWLEKVKAHTYCNFGKIGKIKVGIKTTADKVFIVSDLSKFNGSEPETLRPLITHHVAKRYKADKPSKFVVYTHEIIAGKKQAIDLQNYPNTKRYLESYKKELSSREYISSSTRNWFEIWVPQNPNEWKQPKLVFRDISKEPVFWIDLSGNIVNGDCYWLASNPNQDTDILWLALAIANSKFIEEFYDHKFNNKLYSGRRRFITQYVENFPLPDPKKKISRQIIALAQERYKTKENKAAEKIEQKISTLVYSAFGLSEKKSEGNGI